LGVEIFPGLACSELVYGDNGEIKGVVAGEFGISADGTKGDGYEPGMELHGKYVFLSEGVRGSLSKQVIAKYDLDAGKRAAEIRPWHERNLGDRPRQAQRGHRHAHDGLGPWARTRAAGRSSITSKTIRCMSVSLFTLAIRTRMSSLTWNFSGSSITPW